MLRSHNQLAQQVSSLFAALPQVEAVALGGSRAVQSVATDASSDIDLYVYAAGEIPLATRLAIVEGSGGAARSSLDLPYWGPGDEWINAPTGIEIDIVYFDPAWMEDQISRVIDRHLASLGYSTCFWHTMRYSIPLFDRQGWFAALNNRCQIDFPEGLRRNIIAHNHPVLRSIIPSYASQIKKAIKRHDLVSINHRLAALFASYFDILFALNRQLHPGEKRQLANALNSCSKLPADMETDIFSVLQTAAVNITELPGSIKSLLDHLDETLKEEEILPEKVKNIGP